MQRIVITLRRRGQPARRWVGLFATTADALIHTLDALGDAAFGSSISAKALP
jgi:hypothetical protein